MDATLLKIHATNTGVYHFKPNEKGFALIKVKPDTVPFWQTLAHPLFCNMSLLSKEYGAISIKAFALPIVSEDKQLTICTIVRGDSFLSLFSDMENYGFTPCEPLAEFEGFFEQVCNEEELSIQEEMPGMWMDQLYFKVPCNSIISIECEFDEESEEQPGS